MPEVVATEKRTMKVGRQFRHFSIEQPKAAASGERAKVVDPETRTVRLSFSSELPVSRWWGKEILSHEPGAANLGRLNDGASLLFNHKTDQIIGAVVPGSAEIGADKRGYATLRFSKNARAQEMMQDVDDGIIRNVSFAYDIYRAIEDVEEETYTAIDWEAFEISLVAIPADPTVGIGREATGNERDVVIEKRSTDQPANADAPKGNAMPETAAAAAVPAVDEVKIRAEAATNERERIAAIDDLGKRNNMPDVALKLIQGGASVEHARGVFLDAIMLRIKGPVAAGAGSAALDLSQKEKAKYSMLRAIAAAAGAISWETAGFERECSLEISKKLGRDAQDVPRGGSFFMPVNLPFMPDGVSDPAAVMRQMQRAAYSVGAAATGGVLVPDMLMASSFIEILRNRAKVVGLGARMLSGLTGNVDIPRQSGAGVAYWVGEGNPPTEAEATFEKIALTPRTLGAYSIVYRSMMLQASPDVEALSRNDMALILALALDAACLYGTGSSGQPMGISNTPGIGSVVGGTNGANITINNLIDLETQVTAANAPEDTLAYLANAKTVGSLKKLVSSTGQYLWTTTPMGTRSATPGEINGYPIARSNQVRSTLTKGSSSGICSELYFGNWAELLIGEWGVLEMLVNPYGAAYTKGGVEIRALQTVDVATRHPASFSVMSDALTP